GAPLACALFQPRVVWQARVGSPGARQLASYYVSMYMVRLASPPRVCRCVTIGMLKLVFTTAMPEVLCNVTGTAARKSH
ncbi:MAG: hypothetical protein ABI456_07440, partial [Ktedonobacteraceae bacterium]